VYVEVKLGTFCSFTLKDLYQASEVPNINERNVLNCPTVVIKKKTKKHHTFGTIPKSTISILVLHWLGTGPSM
jgi:hypothetical protein